MRHSEQHCTDAWGSSPPVLPTQPLHGQGQDPGQLGAVASTALPQLYCFPLTQVRDGAC